MVKFNLPVDIARSANGRPNGSGPFNPRSNRGRAALSGFGLSAEGGMKAEERAIPAPQPNAYK